MLAERGIDLAGNQDVRTLEFIDQMDTCMAAADLIVCRAGAITISEIEATGKPALLIPSPNVTENHQYHNAMVLVNKGAALILEEKDYSAEAVVSIVKKLYGNRSMLADLSQNASKLAILDTAKRIYDSMTALLSERKR